MEFFDRVNVDIQRAGVEITVEIDRRRITREIGDQPVVADSAIEGEKARRRGIDGQEVVPAIAGERRSVRIRVAAEIERIVARTAGELEHFEIADDGSVGEDDIGALLRRIIDGEVQRRSRDVEDERVDSRAGVQRVDARAAVQDIVAAMAI